MRGAMVDFGLVGQKANIIHIPKQENCNFATNLGFFFQNDWMQLVEYELRCWGVRCCVRLMIRWFVDANYDGILVR